MAQLPQALHAIEARCTIKLMDWQFAVGLGAAAVFFFIPYVVKDMPAYVTWPGIVTGLLLIIWGILPDHERIPMGPALLFIVSIAGVVASGFWYRDFAPAETASNQRTVAHHNQQQVEETPLPSNAKFKYKDKIFLAISRPYTEDENKEIRLALREIYDCISTHSEHIIANYDGPAPMFTREWLSIVERHGAGSAIKQLDDIRNKVIFAYTELQTVLKRRPYFQQDIMEIIDDRGEVGNMNGSLNEYIEAIQTLPDAPNTELIKLAIRDMEAKFENAIKMYTDWIIRFNMKMNLVKGELDTLMAIE